MPGIEIYHPNFAFRGHVNVHVENEIFIWKFAFDLGRKKFCDERFVLGGEVFEVRVENLRVSLGNCYEGRVLDEATELTFSVSSHVVVVLF